MDDVIVLYEDSDVVAVNKPAGLVVHADGRTEEPTLVDWILAHYPATVGVGEPLSIGKGVVIERPGIVHRIDRETSGVLLIAKTQDAFLDLKRQFFDREIQKNYVAFLYGVPKEREGIITLPIGRNRRDFRRFATGEAARQTVRDAETRYRVRESSHEYSFVEAAPKTGRTHQLRVHFSSIGHPIVADRTYAPKLLLGHDNLGLKRLALHALSISFLRLDGSRVTIEAAFPLDFEDALAALRRAR